MNIESEGLFCPKCRIKTAFKRSFGKRGHCSNCNHDWSLKWKGSHTFSSKMRVEYA